MSEDQLAHKIPPSPADAQAEYDSMYAAVTQTAQGRRFLDQHARRHTAAKSRSGGEAVAHISGYESLDLFLFDVADMAQAIARTKAEIAAIKPPPDGQGQIDDATGELDSIVRTTESATSRILAAAEQMQEIAWTLREKGIDESFCDQLDAQATEIYIACSFQDLTGQRTRKVIQVLRYLEHRVNTMIEIWGKDVAPAPTHEPDSTADVPMSGPSADGLNQADVDLMMQGLEPADREERQPALHAVSPAAAGEELARERQDATIEDIGRVMMALGPLMATNDDAAAEAPEATPAASLDEPRPQLSTTAAVLNEAANMTTSEAETAAMPPDAIEPAPETAAAVETSEEVAVTVVTEADPPTTTTAAIEPAAMVEMAEAAEAADEAESHDKSAPQQPVPEIGVSLRTTAALLQVQAAAPKPAAEPAWSVLERLALTFIPERVTAPSQPVEPLESQPFNLVSMPTPMPMPESSREPEPAAVSPDTEFEWVSALTDETHDTPVAMERAPSPAAEIKAAPSSEPAASMEPAVIQASQVTFAAQEEELEPAAAAFEIDADDFLFASEEPAQGPAPEDFLLEPMPMPPSPAQPAAPKANGGPPEPAPVLSTSAPPTFAARLSPKPASRTNDPLAPLRALSDDEKIALFS